VGNDTPARVTDLLAQFSRTGALYLDASISVGGNVANSRPAQSPS
jgi:hypothetical protein